MSRHPRRDRNRDREWRQHDDRGQTWEVAAYLSDGPRTKEDVAEHYRSYLRWLGFFNVSTRLGGVDKHARLMDSVQAALDDLLARGWAVREGDRYTLTELGREEAAKPIADMRRTRETLGKLVAPETVSKVSLGVHLVLAALKLPAGLISGSVGLINDATDTLLDGISSLLVYAGLRFDKERTVNVVLVLLMLITGILTFYEAVRRFFVPFEPDVDWFTFAATIISATLCAALWAYQRFVGVRSGSVALITQSVDSRNHVTVAASVTAGLIASLLRFPLLDTLVGLGVAVLILKSAIELAIEVIRTLGEENLDLSHHKFGLIEKYEQFRQAQLCDWMLYLVEKGKAQTRSDLVAQGHRALDFSGNPMLRELGLAEQPRAGETVELAVADLFERGWLAGREPLDITDAGRERLGQQMGRTRGHAHRLLDSDRARFHTRAGRHRRWGRDAGEKPADSSN